MIDKVQKIKDWISKEQDGLMDTNGNFEYPEHEGAYHILCNLDTFIDSLQEEPIAPKVLEDMLNAKTAAESLGISQEEHDKIVDNLIYGKEPELVDVDDLPNNEEEPVSKDFTKALAECIHKAQCSVIDPLAHAEVWKEELVKLAKCEEPVSEELEEEIDKLSKQFPEVSFAKLSRIAVRVSKWQKEKLWKPADGDDLPEIDKEVIVLVGIKTPVTTDSMWGCEVAFAHRPNPNGWDGKSITTGEVEHYEAQTYGKGGWSVSDVKYWLDIKFPNEQRGYERIRRIER